ncbi:outer membrane protein assembly factor BamC [Aestuariibacter halophilus]|uniref:Outer membrane protein assembly factor BamC n=1 Tax=Fluctibacter halophilus TaxID=226011 RepID=A0ABS8G505_9ALTE|nr:outer membrane protein assembly factor BamC [Aestuariibacter halophilus]MCC2615578.1 outer membrane protein assembly factor BamC [Aestuariibacter halophilus]
MARATIFTVSSIALTLLAGCSTLSERQIANGDFEYLEASNSTALKVPEGLDQPPAYPDWNIPALETDPQSALVGKAVKVSSPALVLPVVSGSHIEEGHKEATVFFDQVDDSQPLDVAIWNSLISFLEEQGIGVMSFDKDNQVLITDWMIVEEEHDGGWFDWTTTERSVGKRFEFKLDVKPHGRTASLKAELKDFLQTEGDNATADLAFEQERSLEVDVLNQVISHYENQIRVADARRLKQIRSGFTMERGFDADGNPAYVVNGEYDLVWPRLLLVLRKLGFNVKDLDQSNGLLFVNYGSSDIGWWDKLWGDDGTELPIDADAYRIQVTKSASEKTTFTLLTDDNQAFTADKVSELYDAFARTMAQDNLDI